MESVVIDFIMKHFLTHGFLVINNMVSLKAGQQFCNY